MSASTHELESIDNLDTLTGVSAAGTISIAAAYITDIDIIIFDTKEFSAVKLGYFGTAECGGLAEHALAGSWDSNPTVHKKAKVKIFSAGFGGGASGVYIYDMSGKQFGEFYSTGVQVGFCELFEEFNVKNLNPLSLKSEGARGRAEGTLMTDFFVIEDPIYGQQKAAVIKDFDPSDGDILHFGGNIADSLPLKDELDIKVVQTSNQLMEASEEDLDFVYYEPLGYLYHDQNSEARGFGSDGGVIAVLDGGPNLNIESFLIAG